MNNIKILIFKYESDVESINKKIIRFQKDYKYNETRIEKLSGQLNALLEVIEDLKEILKDGFEMMLKKMKYMILDLLENEVKSFKRYPISEERLYTFIKYCEEKKSNKTEYFKGIIEMYKFNKSPYLEKYLNEVIWKLNIKI